MENYTGAAHAPMAVMKDNLVVSIAVGALLIWLMTKKRSKKNLPQGVIYPPHLVSWVPFMGSALDLTKSHLRDFVLKNAKKLDTPVFTANIAGNQCLFIADSDLVPIVYKDNIKEIDSYTLNRKFVKNVMGYTWEETDAMWEQNKVGLDLFHKHLIKDKNLHATLHKMQGTLHEQISPMQVTEWTKAPMLEWVIQTIYKATLKSILSESVCRPDLVEQYLIFDLKVPMLVQEMPSFMTRDAVKARDIIVKECVKEEFWDTASPFLLDRRDQLKLSKELLARLDFGVVWAALGNSIPAVFWVLYHIFNDKATYNAIDEEVKRIAAKREEGRDHFTAAELDELVLIKSTFLEVLRMYQVLFSARFVTDDFVLNPKETKKPKYMIEKGSFIYSLPNTMHHDPAIFKDPETFKYDRFMNPAERTDKGTLLSSHLRPFGGGAHLCPGRKFIDYEVRALVAKMMLSCEFRLVAEAEPLGVNLERQGFNVAFPDRDPVMEYRMRDAV